MIFIFLMKKCLPAKNKTKQKQKTKNKTKQTKKHKTTKKKKKKKHFGVLYRWCESKVRILEHIFEQFSCIYKTYDEIFGYFITLRFS